MSDKKRDPNYKVLAGYVPQELAARVRAEVKERKTTLNDFLEEASLLWLTGAVPGAGTISELVTQNFSILKKAGISATNLSANGTRHFSGDRKGRSTPKLGRLLQNN